MDAHEADLLERLARSLENLNANLEKLLQPCVHGYGCPKLLCRACWRLAGIGFRHGRDGE